MVRKVRPLIMYPFKDKSSTTDSHLATLLKFLRELRNRSHAECRKFVEHGQRLCDRLERLPVPVIAAVRGICLGGGCELAMACTMRLASENAKLGQPEVKLGIMPGYGGSQRLPRLVGKGVAMQILLTGDPITAARIDAVRARGGEPFDEYQVPLAILTLQQGLGRLIRHRRDRGVLAVLDPRLRTKGYGKRFLASLPPAPVVHDLWRIEAFFQ